MNIVVLKRKKGCSGLVTLSKTRLFSLVFSIFIVVPVSAIYLGYHWGIADMRANPDDMRVAMQTEVDSQRLKISEVTRSAEENMNALAMRMGKLQAHVIRLDALGQRLTQMAKLEKGEFDFSRSPAQGGPAATEGDPIQGADFVKSLQELSAQLEDRSQQLSVLEEMMMNRNLQAEVMPAGRPVNRGWLSSFFGLRTDPFTGHKVHHSGVDFAGKMGSDIVSVGAGVVTFAGRRSGYGNLVEVNHGSGYVTRYGHCQEILVKVGDTLQKGQVVAKMGSTGRSTGPHVHFEVMKNGRAVNPKRYIQASR